MLTSVLLLFSLVAGAVAQQCDSIEVGKRIDCFPDAGANEKDCQSRGCCWKSAANNPGQNSDVPWCFYPTDYSTYVVSESKQTAYGYSATLKVFGNSPVYWPKVIGTLNLEVHHFPQSGFVRVRIVDPANKRFEVPDKFPAHETEDAVSSPTVFPTKLTDGARGFSVSDQRGRVLFDSTIAPLIFADQFIQFSTWVNSSYAYGFGEVMDVFAKPTNTWRQFSLFAVDEPPYFGKNLYGVHPFGMFVRADGSSYGVFFLNSNAMDIAMSPYPGVTFRTIGGIIDLFLYAGSTPEQVLKQHLIVVGRPIMPPYWALGFHLSRYGYNTEQNLRTVIDRNIAAKMPYDVQWLDIDTFDEKRDWTVDKKNFPTMTQLVKELHDKSMRVVPIADPAIQVLEGYNAYDRGVKADVFIKDNGAVLIGQVWPGNTTFPDFTHPKVYDWWYEDALDYYKNLVEFDGLWIDMNEPANFVRGSITGCAKSEYDNPPYVPNIIGRNEGLKYKTTCMSATQTAGRHYDLHSLYGHFESKVTNEVVRNIIKGKRPFVLTRSSFAGTGRYAHHWTGDVGDGWEFVDSSIADMINFNLFGIPFVGADICGYFNNAEEHKCVRWMQVGSFYPFMRNHNGFGSTDQDPAAFSERAQTIMRNALNQRYSMLPYFYTLHWRASTFGDMVIRPLFWEYPHDSNALGINSQFMLGPAMLVSPVVDNSTKKLAYIPSGTWYDISGQFLSASGQTITIDAPLDHIPLHVRGGYVIPMQHHGVTTEHSRKNHYYLVAALSIQSRSAEGEVYIDDGVTDAGPYSHIKFTATDSSFSNAPQKTDYNPSTNGYSATVESITVFGIINAPRNAFVNGNATSFTYDGTTKVLKVQVGQLITNSFIVTWIGDGTTTSLQSTTNLARSVYAPTLMANFMMLLLTILAFGRQ